MATDVFGKAGFDFFKKAAEAKIPTGSTTPKPPGWKGKGDRTKQAANPIVLRQSDFRRPVAVTDAKGNVRRRVMTPKQRIMAEYLLKGYSRRQAMIHAGYGKKVVQILNTRKYNRTVLAFVETMSDKLEQQGVTKDKLAGKLSEMLDAQKSISVISGKKADEKTMDFIDIPDYDTQIKAYDRIEKIMNPPNKGKDEGIKKREVSFTEWINGDQTVTEAEVAPEGGST